MQFNEFSFSTLWHLLRSRTRRIVINCAIAAVAGFLIAWCIPKEYVSGASIIPEAGSSQMGGGLSALTSMAGIDLGDGEDAIGPDLYPTVVVSNRFVVDLLYTRVQTVDGEVDTDLVTYTREYCRMPWWGHCRKWVGRMMKKIMPQPPAYNKRGEDDRIDPTRLSMDDEMMLEGIKNCIDCQADEKTGMINIAFRSQDPLVSKTIVDTITARLQQFITDYRTSKARIDLTHYQELEAETHARYEAAQLAYAAYCDSHKGTLLQAYQSEMEALETELSIALTAYTSMKQQVQLSEAKVQEKTPAFTVVEVASVPPRHASPHKLLMAIAFAFLTGMITVGWYYVRLLLGKEDEA